jgi:hypothetical protein
MESIIEDEIEEALVVEHQKPAEPPKITHCTVLQDDLLEALKTVAPFAAKNAAVC